MSATPRILGAVLLAVLIFGLYSWYSTRNVDAFDINSQQYAHAHVEEAPTVAPLTRGISPGGPGAPNQQPSVSKGTVIVPEETPFDPQAESHEDANAPENLRHPERMYGPGLVNDETATAAASGTASYATQKTEQAFQVFGPEHAQNGGSFLDNGVVANDTSVDMSYSEV